MIYYKKEEEIELLRESAMLVVKTLSHVASILKPGITGIDIDRQAEELILDHDAKPGFKNYKGFPATLCISVNEGVVHGIPTDRPFEDGDIVSVDCGVFKDDFFGDSAYTFAIGNVEDATMELLSVTYTSLYKAIDQAIAGNRIGDIGFAVQNYCEKQHKYGVVRELVGHGIGRNLHEAPEVPNFGSRGRGIKLKEGLVLAIEPMVNLGRKEVRAAKDGWTIITKDKSPSAHYENMVAVKKEKADILTDYSLVDQAVKNNPEIREISIKN
ncbi:MAG: type I methionyl aminopeptidase [Bacteroidota bacterium]